MFGCFVHCPFVLAIAGFFLFSTDLHARSGGSAWSLSTCLRSMSKGVVIFTYRTSNRRLNKSGCSQEMLTLVIPSAESVAQTYRNKKNQKAKGRCVSQSVQIFALKDLEHKLSRTWTLLSTNYYLDVLKRQLRLKLHVQWEIHGEGCKGGDMLWQPMTCSKNSKTAKLLLVLEEVRHDTLHLFR